jgi:hypothetical protein
MYSILLRYSEMNPPNNQIPTLCVYQPAGVSWRAGFSFFWGGGGLSLYVVYMCGVEAAYSVCSACIVSLHMPIIVSYSNLLARIKTLAST